MIAPCLDLSSIAGKMTSSTCRVDMHTYIRGRVAERHDAYDMMLFKHVKGGGLRATADRHWEGNTVYRVVGVRMNLTMKSLFRKY